VAKHYFEVVRLAGKERMAGAGMETQRSIERFCRSKGEQRAPEPTPGMQQERLTGGAARYPPLASLEERRLELPKTVRRVRAVGVQHAPQFVAISRLANDVLDWGGPRNGALDRTFRHQTGALTGT
jgi:hypothetical protein